MGLEVLMTILETKAVVSTRYHLKPIKVPKTPYQQTRFQFLTALAKVGLVILTVSSLNKLFSVSPVSASPVGVTAQCSEIISITDKLEPLGKKLEKDLQAIPEPKNHQQATSAFGQVSGIFQSSSNEVGKIKAELQGLKIADEKLKGFQANYGNNLQQLANSLTALGDISGKLGEASNENDQRTILIQERPNIKGNLEKVPKIMEGAMKIDSEIKTYCGVKPTVTPTPTPNSSK